MKGVEEMGIGAMGGGAASAGLKEWDRIILGIDPGTNVMGYGVLGVKRGKPAMITMGVIELTKLGDHYIRLRRIYERVLGIVDNYLPDELGKTCSRCSSSAVLRA